MSCAELDDRIEPWAAGEGTPSPEEAAHLQSCPRCTHALTLARRLERSLAGHAWVQVPPRFTPEVMRRISADHWQREQRVDRAFNAVLAAGGSVVIAAIAYAFQISGATAVLGRAADEAGMVWRNSVGTISMEPLLYAAAALAGVAALLWRRREGDELL
jgi:hypothetical protein